MAVINISNTLVNDTANQVIAYAKQLLDENYDSVKYPNGIKQSEINRLLKDLKDQFTALLNTPEDIDRIINTFLQINQFLQNVDNTTLYSTIDSLLLPIKTAIEANLIHLAISFDPITGDLTALSSTTSSSLSDKSQINPDTGEVELVFNF